MKSILLFLSCIFLCTSTELTAQSKSSAVYEYEFKLSEATTPGTAKLAHDAFIREVFSAVATFDDDQDSFYIQTSVLISQEAFESKAIHAGYGLLNFYKTTIE
jgi:hypothetical protein